MGWRSGFAALALAAGASLAAVAAEPGASYGTYDGRDYVLLWPSTTPTRLLVYLHAADVQPLTYEASSGMLEALAADSALRGYAVLAPAAGRNRCGAPDGVQASQQSCWRLEAVGDDLALINRLIGYIERNNDVDFETLTAIGYARGGDFLSEALAERWLDGYAKIGLLDAGPPKTALSLRDAAGPVVYVEALEGDRRSAGRAAELLRALFAGGYGVRTCARGDPGDSLYDVRRLAAFLSWFAQDCAAAIPTTAPPRSDTPATVTPTAALEAEPEATSAIAAAGEAVLGEDDAGGPALSPRGPR